MISLNKIFLLIFSFVIFIWLIFTTFLNKNINKFEDVYYKDNEKGTYSLDFKENQIFFNSGSSLKNININYINSFDKILEYNGKISIENNNIINLEKGVYLINFSELNNLYNIYGEGFYIKTNGPQNIFIDNSGIRTIIFSLNSNIEINLINIEDNKIVNTVYLYPHKYLKFIPAQNKNVLNVDLLKLSQRFPLDYFGERILSNGKINENIIKKIVGNKSEDENEKIKNMFLFLYLNNKNEDTLLKNFKSKNFGILVGEKFIEKYNKLFLNENKQVIYYKNLILRSIGEIIKVKGQEESKNVFLIETLNKLKKLNENEYLEMKKILNFYSNLVIDGNKDDINSKIYFSKIGNELEKKEYIFNDDFLLNLNDSYFKYDFLNDYSFYNNLTNINKIIINKELNENHKSYLIFFINKTILSGFDELNNNNNIKLDDILSIFDDYINISIPYYSKNDNVRIRTGIEEYNEILKKLEKEIKKVYFEENRDNQGLLILSKSNNLSIEKIKIFEDNKNKIFNFFENNIDKLGDRAKDELIKKEFAQSKEIYDEYILAIKDYDTYTANYNNKNKEIIFGETINNSNGENSEISINNLLNYLSRFNYLETSHSKISLRGYNYCNNPITKYDFDDFKEPYCYKIEDLIVGSSVELDMILTPSEGNNIFNFIINGDSNSNKGSYKLDNEEIIWKENLSKSGGGKNSDMYKFENFFLYVFNPPNNYLEEDINKENDNKNIIKEESLLVKIFKRNKLFGENGDFKNILSIIDIKYDNVIVEEKGENYDIKINDTTFTYYSQGLKIIGVLSGKYIFLPDHSFSELEIKFLDEGGKKFLYNGNKLKLLGKYNVNELNKDFGNLFSEFSNLNIIINTLLNNNYKIFDIEYDKTNKIFIIKNDKIQIKNYGLKITSIIINGRELIKNEISVYDLESYIK